jgi:hypothetical protein
MSDGIRIAINKIRPGPKEMGRENNKIGRVCKRKNQMPKTRNILRKGISRRQ